MTHRLPAHHLALVRSARRAPEVDIDLRRAAALAFARGNRREGEKLLEQLKRAGARRLAKCSG